MSTQNENQNETNQNKNKKHIPPPLPLSPLSSPTSSKSHKEQEDHSDQFWLLYSSYFFAAWGDRMWEFAAIVFLMQLFPTSLFPSSLFGFSENLAGIVCGGTVGRYIDFTDRLTVIRTSIIGQNVVIFGASIVFAFALARVAQYGPDEKTDTNGHFFSQEGKNLKADDLITLALIVVAGMIAKVTSSMNKISIHKDWSVVLADGNSATQTVLNSNLRRVDLTCSVLAPLAVGVLSSWVDPSFAVKFIALWSFCSLFIELYLSSRVYSSISSLQSPKKAKNSSSPKKQQQQHDEDAKETKTSALSSDSIFRAYLRHPIFPVSLSYCVLYISSLSFGGIMVAYLRTLGCSDALLALGRGIAAFVAIGATYAVPSMVQGLGLVNAGKLSSWLQAGALAPLAYVFLNSIFHPEDALQESSRTLFITAIFVSVCLSRFGLWAFDLCQTQLMQESVDLEFAGRVNGAQEMLVNFCYLAGFVVTMLEDNPKHYAGPALVGFGSVVLCALIFTFLADDATERAVELKKIVEERKKAEEEAEL